MEGTPAAARRTGRQGDTMTRPAANIHFSCGEGRWHLVAAMRKGPHDDRAAAYVKSKSLFHRRGDPTPELPGQTPPHAANLFLVSLRQAQLVASA